MSEYEQKSLDKLGQTIQDSKWSNEGLVKLIELAGSYLNLETIPQYASRTGMSYPGVKNHRKTITVFNQKFVIDNE